MKKVNNSFTWNMKYTMYPTLLYTRAFDSWWSYPQEIADKFRNSDNKMSYEWPKKN